MSSPVLIRVSPQRSLNVIKMLRLGWKLIFIFFFNYRKRTAASKYLIPRSTSQLQVKLSLEGKFSVLMLLYVSTGPLQICLSTVLL